MLILDTHALLWLRSGDSQLGSNARQEIDRALRNGELAVSAISFWEIALMREKNRLEADFDVDAWRAALLNSGVIEMPLDGAIGIRSTSLAGLPRDPADRFIVASALDGHRLLTADRLILNWPGDLERIPADA